MIYHKPVNPVLFWHFLIFEKNVDEYQSSQYHFKKSFKIIPIKLKY
jgi:hypothetical protein